TTLLRHDGESCDKGVALAEWSGPARDIVAAERVALNFLQRLSGIATLTHRYVDAVAHTAAKVLDTRKTTPGWRDIEKYAVRVGGGTNHRRGLYDAILIKDNHIATIAGEGEGEPIERLREPIERVRPLLGASGFVQIEVDTLDQFRKALALPIDIIMLDNMPPAMMAEAVATRNELAPHIELEASGGITLEPLVAAAESGVDRISIGALTHSAPAVDIGLDSSLLQGR
ncbi:MAG: carboxylating nicotinate-nucleotide diphosphorylase, partial [Phycisphaerales bacterium]|nr:carboxylating nicotinate-nucleotide diphosphorylase [Phycisphaerales bacterium]